MMQYKNNNIEDLRSFDQRGFTLIEIMVSLTIISVAILSLGGFSLSVVGNGQLDRERLTAVHLAEQVLEFWQHDVNDYAPLISTTCVLGSAAALPTYPVSTICTPSSGVSASFTINVATLIATAPLPSNPNANNSNAGAFAVRAMVGVATSTPVIKAATVSWSHKGKIRSVTLTGLARP
jgi:prepilin-type N-terminal cleavage/methylation domain-containing protein